MPADTSGRAVPGLVVATLLAASALACGTSGRTPPESPGPGGPATLTIRFAGLESGSGEIVAALFDSASTFDSGSSPVRSTVIAVSGPEASWRLDDLPAGTYAIKAFHDLDGDGRLDKGALGVPREPYGISNDARGRLGPPAFGNAAFRLPPGPTELVIRVR